MESSVLPLRSSFVSNVLLLPLLSVTFEFNVANDDRNDELFAEE